MSLQAVSQQDKLSRELFIGNTPPGTSELLLLHFFNAAMRRVGLCSPGDSPVQTVRVSNKFAFVETTSAEMATQALNLNGIPFLSTVLKVSRPSKYAGPETSAKTWQELTGQSLPTGVQLDPEQDKLSRELFVGNTTQEMSEGMLRDFLGNAMLQVGLNTMPGNPITDVRLSGKFAFISLRTSEEARNALNLNNIPVTGTALRVGRPSKYNGPPDNQGNWEDILSKFMSGELQVPGAKESPSVPVTHTRVVKLENMLTEQDLQDESEYADLLEDIRGECEQFGQLESIVMPKAGESGATMVFLEYKVQNDAARAVEALEGRTFDGRRVQATYFDEGRFAAKDFVSDSMR